MANAIDIDWLANTINDYCNKGEEGGGFWAYGLLKETKSLWKSERWKNKLCPLAKIALSWIDENNNKEAITNE